MNQKQCPLFPFFQASRGNWRNALVIVCQSCPYGSTPICAGHLFVTDALGYPVMIPVEDMNAVAGHPIDITECAGILDRFAFESAYGLFLQWQTDSTVDCPIKQLCHDFDSNSCVLSENR